MLYISWSAKQEAESLEHLSSREYMNKKTIAVCSASFCILFQTPCCTSKCHYGLCFIAAEMRMCFGAEKQKKPQLPNHDYEHPFDTPLSRVSNLEIQPPYVFSGKVTWNDLLNISGWR